MKNSCVVFLFSIFFSFFSLRASQSFFTLEYKQLDLTQNHNALDEQTKDSVFSTHSSSILSIQNSDNEEDENLQRAAAQKLLLKKTMLLLKNHAQSFPSPSTHSSKS